MISINLWLFDIQLKFFSEKHTVNKKFTPEKLCNHQNTLINVLSQSFSVLKNQNNIVPKSFLSQETINVVAEKISSDFKINQKCEFLSDSSHISKQLKIQIKTLSIDTFGDDYLKNLSKNSISKTEKWKLHALAAKSNNSNDICLIGFVIYCLKKSHAEILRIAVVSHARRNGYGRCLIESVIKRVKSSPFVKIICLSALHDSIYFYTNLGFTKHQNIPLTDIEIGYPIVPHQIYMEYLL